MKRILACTAVLLIFYSASADLHSQTARDMMEDNGKYVEPPKKEGMSSNTKLGLGLLVGLAVIFSLGPYLPRRVGTTVSSAAIVLCPSIQRWNLFKKYQQTSKKTDERNEAKKQTVSIQKRGNYNEAEVAIKTNFIKL